MSIQVKEFQWKPGKNDAEYIRLLKRANEEAHALMLKATGKLSKMARSGKSEWISVKDRLPGDIIVHAPTDDDPNVVQYEVTKHLQEYLVTDGENYAVGYWRPDAKAWDSFNFGWIERQDTIDTYREFGIDTVTHWMPLPDLPGTMLQEAMQKHGCCGDKSCSRYYGCVNDCDLSAIKCPQRRK